MTLYRPADLSPDADDRAFVTSTWSSSYKSSHFAGLIASEDWAAIMHVQIGKLLDRPTTRTIVACEPDGFLYGFVAGDTSRRLPVVYYVYVKDPFRSQDEGGGRRGPRHARRLFEALGVDPAATFLYTSRTAIVARLTDKIPRATFAPAAARYTNYYHQESHGHRRQQP